MVRVPKATSTKVNSDDNGFGYGYDIRFEPTKVLKNDAQRIEVAVDVSIPGTVQGKNQAVLVQFVPDGTVEAADPSVTPMNEWISVKSRLHT